MSSSLTEILPIAGACPADALIGDNNPPPLISVDDHCEALQAAERHDEFPLLRYEVVHYG